MKIKQQQYRKQVWKEIRISSGFESEKAQLVLAFGDSSLIGNASFIESIRIQYPNSEIVYVSTAGEIVDSRVFDNTVSLTAICFDKTQVVVNKTNIAQHGSSKESGTFLMSQLNHDGLKAVLVFSDGKSINGSELVEGLNELNTYNAVISGGLAGDAARFEIPYVGLNQMPTTGNVIAIGLYGDFIQVGHSSLGGWDEFGHERTITRSNKNILCEIDGRSALDLYKEYLGPYKDQLPSSALLFPLSVKNSDSEVKVVRTILSIDEDKNCMIFAGNIPEGSKVRLMKANFDSLIDASSEAAQNASSGQQVDLSILVSCIGRKLILQGRIEEEIQVAKAIFGNETVITGFYSYGEISPFNDKVKCELHNQTMTITTLTEI